MKRVLLLAAVLAAPGVAWSQEYKPDFNCSADHSKDSIATMLCQNSEAAKHELIFDQTYYALRQVVGKSGWRRLKQEVISDDIGFKECIDTQNLSNPDIVPKADPICYIMKMDELTDKYKSRLSGAALEEASRSIEDHLRLQQKLIDLGYLPNNVKADGVYGESTRDAIVKWKSENKRIDSGPFLDNSDALVLMNITTPQTDFIEPSQIIKQNNNNIFHLIKVAFSLFIIGIILINVNNYIQKKKTRQ